MLKRELFSFYSHLVGLIAAVAGTVALLILSWGHWQYFIVCLIYGISAINLFTASSVYHASKRGEDTKTIWRKLDHVAIYIMIAGTYTPLAYHYLDGAWFWSIILIQWGLVIAGLFFKLFYLKAPRYLSVSIYLLMGWMVVVFLGKLWPLATTVEIVLLLLGGISYSAGAAIYAIKKPNPVPGVFGFHEIFHVLIIAGAAFHYLVILLLLP
ncbi:MAG: hemolysin III family protein [Dehalococcoidales bacterium]|nr:hemolysin III family protein [Dehalococcoidales bacterium]